MAATWKTCEECYGAILEGYCKTCGNAGVVAETDPVPSNVLPFPSEKTPEINFEARYAGDSKPPITGSIPLEEVLSIERAARRILDLGEPDYHKARLYREQLRLVAFMRSKGILP